MLFSLFLPVSRKDSELVSLMTWDNWTGTLLHPTPNSHTHDVCSILTPTPTPLRNAPSPSPQGNKGMQILTAVIVDFIENTLNLKNLLADILPPIWYEARVRQKRVICCWLGILVVFQVAHVFFTYTAHALQKTPPNSFHVGNSVDEFNVITGVQSWHSW